MAKEPQSSRRASRQQITLRLEPELHQRLTDVAHADGISAARLLTIALTRELARLESSRRDTILSDDQLLAYRFMLAAPTPVVIKDETARIIWANLYYQRMLDRSLEELRGRTVTDLNLLSWERNAVEKDIEEALASEKVGGIWCLEPVVIHGRKRIFGTIRFVFRAGERRHKFVGDVSFEWTTILPGAHSTGPELLEGIRRATLPRGVDELLLPFLNACSTAVAITDAEGKIVFNNDIYRQLTPDPSHSPLNRTKQEVFGLPDAHPIVGSDAIVFRENQWMYTFDAVSKAGPRVSLRFPIPGDDGHPTHVGVISTTIGTDEYEMVFGKKFREDPSRPSASRTGASRPRSDHHDRRRKQRH